MTIAVSYANRANKTHIVLADTIKTPPARFAKLLVCGPLGHRWSDPSLTQDSLYEYKHTSCINCGTEKTHYRPLNVRVGKRTVPVSTVDSFPWSVRYNYAKGYLR